MTLKKILEFYKEKLGDVAPEDWTRTLISVGADDLNQLVLAAKRSERLESKIEELRKSIRGHEEANETEEGELK